MELQCGSNIGVFILVVWAERDILERKGKLSVILHGEQLIVKGMEMNIY